MVDALPSEGMSARDPKEPTASDLTAADGCAGRDDAESGDDARWIEELVALAGRADPVPDAVLAAARAALAARKGGADHGSKP